MGKVEVKFEVGILLGLRLEDMTYIIGADNGDICTSNVIKPLPEDRRTNCGASEGAKT